MKPTIGILGGIGPEASVEFYRKIVEQVQELNFIKSNTDYPHIILNSINAPELFIKPDLSQYKKGLKDLEKAGASFIVIACNTAYAFFEELQKEVNIPILDLRKELQSNLIKRNIKSAFLLASSQLIKAKIYSFPETRIFTPSEADSELLDKIIKNYNLGLNKDKQIVKMKAIVKKYEGKADIFIIGCTEISKIANKMGLNGIDTFEILLDATLNWWLDEKRVSLSQLTLKT